MYLSGTYLGYSSFMSPQSAPTPVEYSKISVSGKGIFDKVHILSEELTLSQLLAIDITAEIAWTNTTVMLAEFNNNLNAGNLNLGGNVTKWEVYRIANGDTNLVKVASVDGAVESFLDYTVPPYYTYTYSVFGSTSTEISEPLTTTSIYADFFNYFLIDEDTNAVYLFDLNASLGTTQNQEDVTIYSTYNQFPTISQGARKYRTTNLSAICGDVECNNVLTQPPLYVDALRDFIMNGRSKIFKTRKGDVQRVYTSNFSYSLFNEGIKSQPMVISFDITELSEV